MADSKVVPPAVTTLILPDGDTLTVKKALNEGERRAEYARMYLAPLVSGDGSMRVNPEQIGISTVIAYLVDWSLKDPEGNPIPIRGLPPEQVQAACDSLYPEDFAEIVAAINAHEAAMLLVRQEKKRKAAGGTVVALTSASAR